MFILDILYIYPKLFSGNIFTDQALLSVNLKLICWHAYLLLKIKTLWLKPLTGRVKKS